MTLRQNFDPTRVCIQSSCVSPLYQSTLTLMVSISRAYSSVVKQTKKDTNPGMQTWVGLTSNHNVMPLQSNALATC